MNSERNGLLLIALAVADEGIFRMIERKSSKQKNTKTERNMMQPGFTETDQTPGHGISMNKTKHSKLGLVLGIPLLGLLSGGIGCFHETHHARYAQPPPAYVESGAVVQDDYVYYPGYQVYYSNSRHQYRYQEGHSWVWRPTPPQVSAEAMASSPSVRLDFHDAPERHHATVVRQYPRNWTPPPQNHGEREGHKN